MWLFLFFISLWSLASEVHAYASTATSAPVRSLSKGKWVKIICGASNSDLPLIRNLCYIYTIAGADCMDVSADAAVVRAATCGIDAAVSASVLPRRRPLLMISVNDDEDPHFRKAVFDPRKCPSDCERPCEKVCPAAAIPQLSDRMKTASSLPPHKGVIAQRCYGCGRCEPVCPLGLIVNEAYVTNRDLVKELFVPPHSSKSQGGSEVLRGVDAIEIHTREGNTKEFEELWNDIGDVVLGQAKVVAVSFGDMGQAQTAPYINALYKIMAQNQYHRAFLEESQGVHIWQTDGRPMSGDLGKGAAHASSEFASRMLSDLQKYSYRSEKENHYIDLRSGQHYLQLAGGTNAYSLTTAESNGILGRPGFGGFAFGGYARKILAQTLREIEEDRPGACIEAEVYQDRLETCLKLAQSLVGSVKVPF